MILLQNVSHSVRSGSGQLTVLRNQSETFGDKERIGIFAETGSGKTTLARLLAGVVQPKFGKVTHIGSVSWPMGLASLLHGDLSIAENVAVISRLSSRNSERAETTFWTMCRGMFHPDHVSKNLSPTERALLGFWVSLMCDRQHYIFDEKICVGTAQQQKRQLEFLEARLEKSGFILISRSRRIIMQHANRFFELTNGSLREATAQDFSNPVEVRV